MLFLSRENQADAGVVIREPLSGAPAPSPANVETVSRTDAKFIKSIDTTTIILPPKEADGPNAKPNAAFLYQQDAPSCSDCGSIMVRNGACYKCLNCGSTSGCS